MPRIVPTPPEIPHIGGFTTENDLFGLRPFGENLVSLVRGVDDPLVVLLDGPWGSGKSTFIAQWSGLLRQKGIAVINFDAFASDYSDDAFTALAGEIFSFARDNSYIDEHTEKKFLDSAKKVGGHLLPAAVKAALRVGTMGLINADSEQLEAQLENIAQVLTDDVTDLAEQLIQDRVLNAQNTRDEVQQFRTELKKIAKAMKDGQDHQAGSSLIVIIDELDRCRPSFAVNVLERIKHFFSVEGISFVLVTNQAQLENTVKGIYGSEFDAKNYLQKFFQLRVTLPRASSETRGFNRLSTYADYLWNNLELNTPQNYGRRICDGIAHLAEGHSLELRDLEHIFSSLSLFTASTGESTFRPDPIVVVLAIIRLKNPKLFDKCQSGSITWKEVSTFISHDKWADPDSDQKWYTEWWRGALDESWMDTEGNQAKKHLSQAIVQYRLRSPRDAIQFLARLMADIRVNDGNTE